MVLQSARVTGQDHTGDCFWCKRSGNLAGCSTCPRCFCFNCYKTRPGYGIVNWGRMLKTLEYSCPVCSGREPASCEGGKSQGSISYFLWVLAYNVTFALFDSLLSLRCTADGLLLS